MPPAVLSPSLRIVSLVPSVTELLCALGLAPWLVGRTGFCIHPAGTVQRIPKVGGTKDVNLRKLRALQPTHVVVNVDENEWPTVQQIEAMGVRVVVTHPQAPQDNIALVRQMAHEFPTAPGVAGAAAALEAQIAGALAAFSPAQPQTEAPLALYLIWRDPWMTVARDTYISRMLGLIGWQTWPPVEGGERGAARYPRVELAEAARAGVNRVLLSSEPYRFEAANCAEVQAMFPHARVQLVDGEAFSWYGSRCLAGFAALHTLAAEA